MREKNQAVEAMFNSYKARIAPLVQEYHQEVNYAYEVALSMMIEQVKRFKSQGSYTHQYQERFCMAVVKTLEYSKKRYEEFQGALGDINSVTKSQYLKHLSVDATSYDEILDFINYVKIVEYRCAELVDQISHQINYCQSNKSRSKQGENDEKLS
jgi:hypothetical protein